MWGRIVNSTVQTVLTGILIGIYTQETIPVPAAIIPAWTLWIIKCPAITVWNAFDISFVTTCTWPTTYGGFNPFSDDDYISMCNIPMSYQTMIAGSFIAAYGHMLNDWLYRNVKNVEAGVNNRLSTVGGGGNTPAAVAGAEAAAGNAAKGAVDNAFSGLDDEVEMWHHNAAATIETIALGSSTGLIAALSTSYWGADGPAIEAMKLIIKVQIMATYVIQGVQSIQPLLSLALIVWTYIMDFEKMMAWTICIYNWTLGPIVWIIMLVWGTIAGTLSCAGSVVTCTCCPSWCCCCAAKPDYQQVPDSDAAAHQQKL